MTKAIDLGCWKDCIKGYDKVYTISLESSQNKNHIKMDIDNEKLPFQDNSVDYIYAHHVLEHLSNLIFVIKECHRVLKPNGRMLIHVPYWHREELWADFTHKRGFNRNSFDKLDPRKNTDPDNYGSSFFIEARYGWCYCTVNSKKGKLYHKVMSYLANNYPRLSRIFGYPTEVIFEMVKV